MTFEQFAEKHGVTMRAERAPANPNLDADEWKGAAHWYCTLECEGRRMSLHYSMGAAYRRFVRAVNMGKPWGSHRKGDRVPYSVIAAKRLYTEDIIRRDTAPIPPTVADVLECLHSSASYADCDLDTFAEEYCNGEKPSEVIRTHTAHQRQIGELRAVLGPLWGEFEAVDSDDEFWY